MPVLYKNVPLAIQRDQQLPLCTNGKSCIETKCVVKNIADKRQLQINSFQRLITWYNTTDNSTYAVAFNYSKKENKVVCERAMCSFDIPMDGIVWVSF